MAEECQTQTITLPQKPSSSSKHSSQSRKCRKLSSGASPVSFADQPSQITSRETNDSRRNTRKPVKISTARLLRCKGEIHLALSHLRNSAPKLAPLIDAHEPPKFVNFDLPFLALAKSIIYQQISRKAGTAIYNRFVSLCGGEARVCPISVLALTPPQLLQIGVSSRKLCFLHDLANKYRTGILCDSKIATMEDKALVSLISMVKGFCALSVHMFMIFTLHRPDVLPIGDINLRKGVQILYGLEQLPRPSQMDQICENWRPYRSVASWYMWKFAEANGGQAKAEVMEDSGASCHLQQSDAPEIGGQISGT